MEFTHPLASAVPGSPAPHENDVEHCRRVIAHYRKLVVDKQLGSLANNTKWNELITTIRRHDRHPSYRWKCIDGPPSNWDVEWWYHLPFPFISVQWFDIGFIQRTSTKQLVDHSEWTENLLREINFEYLRGTDFFRIFGYAPKNMDAFED